MLAMIVPLLLIAAAAPSDADRSEVEARVVTIFGPYAGPADAVAAWDRPIFSAEVSALIGRWKAVIPEGEPDGLNDGDWLCQCQDWDAEDFQATIVSIVMTGDGTAEVEVSLDLGFGGSESTRPARLTLKREQGVWQIDEIVAEGFPHGLEQALRETIAADEALAAGNAG